MKIIVDVDGTVCNTEGNNYETAVPIPENIAKINKLYNEGHNITYWTARGSSSGVYHLGLTHDQLKQWGCRYDDLIVGKPSYDLWIDDKAKRIEEL
jgi:hypothetical protein